MILLSHPTANQNVRQAATAFLEAGLLEEFWTCVSWKKNGLLDRFAALSARFQKELRRRSFPVELAPFIRTVPWRELGRQGAAQIGWKKLTRAEDALFSVDAVYRSLDRRVAQEVATGLTIKAIYAYEDGALDTFRAAKERGIKCIFEQPTIYWRMCGIAAHFNFRGPATALNLQLIAHRGPDAAGEWISANRRFWLGNTRLAILDLSPAGAQPMVDSATGNVIVVNGEIYNHRALRTELGDADWRGTSDTETLLLGYARWGHRLLDRIKGMFAFVIYDYARQEFFVARDRLGIKPLYYAVDAGGIRLASEVKVLSEPGSTITSASIGAYLQWGACPEDQLLYSGIHGAFFGWEYLTPKLKGRLLSINGRALRSLGI